MSEGSATETVTIAVEVRVTDNEDGTWTAELGQRGHRRWRRATSRSEAIAGVVAESSADSFRCTWTEDDDGVWDTDCGNRFETVEGTPHENDMLFCCYCGRPLVENSSC